MRKLILSFLAAAAVTSTLSVAEASFPTAVWVKPTKVEYSPDKATATNVVIHGTFLLWDSGKSAYMKPAVGFIHYVCPVGSEATCRMEWSEIEAQIGTAADQCRGYGSQSQSPGTLIAEGNPPGTPDTYPLQMGVVQGFTPCQEIKMFNDTGAGGSGGSAGAAGAAGGVGTAGSGGSTTGTGGAGAGGATAGAAGSATAGTAGATSTGGAAGTAGAGTAGAGAGGSGTAGSATGGAGAGGSGTGTGGSSSGGSSSGGSSSGGSSSGGSSTGGSSTGGSSTGGSSSGGSGTAGSATGGTTGGAGKSSAGAAGASAGAASATPQAAEDDGGCSVSHVRASDVAVLFPLAGLALAWAARRRRG